MKHVDFKDGNVIEILEEIIDLIKVSYWRLAGIYLYILADELRKQDPRKRRQRMDDPKSSDRTRAATVPDYVAGFVESRSEEEWEVIMELWAYYIGHGEFSECTGKRLEECHGGRSGENRRDGETARGS